MAFPIHEVTEEAESPARPPSTSPSLTSSTTTAQTSNTLITLVQPLNEAPVHPPILPPTPPLPRNSTEQHPSDVEPAAVYLLDALFTTTSSAFPFLTESTTPSDVNATPLFVEIRKAGFVGLTNKVVPSFFGPGGSTNANRRIEAKWKAGWPIPVSADRIAPPSVVSQQSEVTNENALLRVCVKTIGALGSEKILATQSLNLEAFLAQACESKFQCRLQFGPQGTLILTFKSTFPVSSVPQKGRASLAYSPRLSNGNPLWGHSPDRTPRTSGASPRPSTASRPTPVITKRPRIPSLLARIFSPHRPSSPCHFPRNAVTAVDPNQSGNSSGGSASHLPLAKPTSTAV